MKRGTWRSLIRLFDGSRRTIVASVLVSVLQAAMLAPVAILVSHAFDKLVPQRDMTGITLTGLAILGLYVGSAALGLLTRHTVLKVTRRAIVKLRGELLEHVYTLPRAYFDRTSVGELHSVIVQDSGRVDALANGVVGLLIPNLTVGLGLVVVLAVLNPLLFGVLVAVVPVMLLAGRWIGRSERVRTRRWMAAFDVFSSKTQLALRAITLAKVQDAERIELEQRRAEHVEEADARVEMAWIQSARSNVQNAVAASSGAVVLVIGGHAVASGDMTIGSLLSFYAVLALALRQITSVLQTWPGVVIGREAMGRLDAFLSLDESEPYTGTRQIDFSGALELDAVTFSYGDEPLLRDVSLALRPGEHMAIFGPNGAGKSTLVSLLVGLYRPRSGRVLADGVPYDALDIRALRRSIGVVLQDPVIFPGTIAENIAYGHPDATPEDIRRAARWATADTFIERFPDRYETEVGDEGGRLSGGQRQRIAIARALIAGPALLILDEPTTHLDDGAIRALISNLSEFPGAPTVLIITHDPEAARGVDSVCHLRDGRVVRVESPTEPELADVH